MGIFKKIFKKEYKKLKLLLLAMFLLNLGSVGYILISLKSAFSVNSSVFVWVNTIEKNELYFYNLLFTMSLTGIVLGLMQFLPEFDKKRYRISCHLPVSETGMIFSMFFSGMIFLSVIAFFSYVLLFLLGSAYFPEEIYGAAYPVYIKGYYRMIAWYLMMSVVVLEPNKFRKAFLIVVLMPMSFIFSIAGGYNTLNGQLIPYLIMLICFIPMILSPAYRFRKGDF